MRAVVQRCARALVTVDTMTIGEIGPGLAVFVGIGPRDDGATATRLAARVATLRVFPDEQGRMNLDIAESGGELLVVSQFTLFADASRGHRPSFAAAAPPEQAQQLYEAFVDALRDRGIRVATGRFGTAMEVALVNDGPVTIVLSSGEEPWRADAG